MGSPLRDRSASPSPTGKPGVFASDLPGSSPSNAPDAADTAPASASSSSPSSSSATSPSSDSARPAPRASKASASRTKKEDSWVRRLIEQRLAYQVAVAIRGLSSVPAGREYSDGIHPCVILESRRIVRTSLFIAGFIALHLLVATGFAAQQVLPEYLPEIASDLAEYHEWIFWGSVALPLLIVAPGAALFGLSWDIHIRALETILMTRLRPFGIAYGKWMSKAIEAVLMASALMPYVMARYYLYGANPVSDTACLIGIVLLSCCLSAIATALSTVASVWVRLLGAVSVLLCFAPLGLLTYIAMDQVSGGSGGGGHANGKGGLGSVLCVVLLAAPIGTVAALGVAASAIGPLTYNGSYIPRKCALLLTVPWAVGVFTDIFGPTLATFQLFTGALLFVPIMLEDMRTTHGLHMDVRIATASGTTDDSLVMPGWQTGVWWAVGALCLWLMPTSVASEMVLNEGVLILVPAFSSIFFPFVIIRGIGLAGFTKGIFCMRPETAFIWYFTITAFFIAIGIASNREYIEPAFLAVIPPMQCAWTIVWTNPSHVVNNPIAYIASAWPVPVLLVMAYWDKKMRFKEAADARAELALELAMTSPAVRSSAPRKYMHEPPGSAPAHVFLPEPEPSMAADPEPVQAEKEPDLQPAPSKEGGPTP